MPANGTSLRSALLVAVLAFTSCGGGTDNCTPPVGDFVFYEVSVDSASLEWSLDTVPMHAAALEPSPSVGDCGLRITPGRIPDPAGTIICQQPQHMWINIDCVVRQENIKPPLTIDPASRWTFEISVPGDPRTWPVGELSASYLSEGYPGYLRDSAGCTWGRSDSGLLAGLHLSVEESTGDIAPFPQAVTQDYRKVLRIDLDLNETIASSISGTCGVTAAMTMSLRLVQTPADFEEKQDACTLCK